MKSEAVRHAQPSPTDNVAAPPERQSLGDLFALLGNERLEQALAELEPTRRPPAKA